ncbi:MAG: hypothetical protein A2390_01545 [Candidatus Liptonbacteria bacterium RIFOXYB1_FULL_36_10]|uniref:Uncharacterized protein n=3 Tax=Candidatus Liptoniibacteriota TaxID=1817909 RepID=A0A1G2CNL1_9BACT|nr:MAG: hypothetical protein A2390_01545 [Candidatus Liptonbacteria bacterium RIFOXYB1_FULL_36_10]
MPPPPTSTFCKKRKKPSEPTVTYLSKIIFLFFIFCILEKIIFLLYSLINLFAPKIFKRRRIMSEVSNVSNVNRDRIKERLKGIAEILPSDEVREKLYEIVTALIQEAKTSEAEKHLSLFLSVNDEDLDISLLD